MNFKVIWDIIKQIVNEYSDDKAPKLGAALAYYTVFSLAPLLLIAIAVAGLIFGHDAAQGRIYYEIQGLIGKDGAALIQTAIKNSSDTKSGILAAIISVVTLGIGATAVFIELQDSLNMIWKVKPKPNAAIKDFIRNRLISFALVVAMGFLLLVSLLLSAGISALSSFVGSFFSIPVFVLQIINIIVSLAFIFVLFSMIYKILPDVKLSWKDVRNGALFTSLLFIIGKYLIGLYLGSSSISSTYGAAGALAVLLVWIYYSSQILFLGAEFTYVYAQRFGSGIKPSDHAETLEETKFNAEAQAEKKETGEIEQGGEKNDDEGKNGNDRKPGNVQRKESGGRKMKGSG